MSRNLLVGQLHPSRSSHHLHFHDFTENSPLDTTWRHISSKIVQISRRWNSKCGCVCWPIRTLPLWISKWNLIHRISTLSATTGVNLVLFWCSSEFLSNLISNEIRRKKLEKFSGASGVCGSSAVQWWQRRNIPSIDDLSSCRVFVQRETVGSGSVNAGGRDRCQAKISSAANHLALFCAPRFGELFSDFFQCCSWIPPLREPRQRRVKWYFCG